MQTGMFIENLQLDLYRQDYDICYQLNTIACYFIEADKKNVADSWGAAFKNWDAHGEAFYTR